MGAIRFRKLVKAAGKPQTKPLWIDPKTDREFMRAVKQNKVLTVIQEPRSKRKDFGQIGFHQRPYASYLAFQKPLSADNGTKVIGLDYSLIQEPEVRNPVQWKRSQSPKTQSALRPRNQHQRRSTSTCLSGARQYWRP